MENCAGSSSTKYRALKDILAYLKSLLAKKKITESQLTSLFNTLSGVIGSKISTGQASTSDVRKLVDQHLPAALANMNANNASSGAGSAKFGDGGNALTSSKLTGFLNGTTSSGSFFDPTRNDTNNGYSSGKSGSIPSSFGTDMNGANDGIVGNYDPNLYLGGNTGSAGGENWNGNAPGLGSLAGGDGTGGMDGVGSFNGDVWNPNGSTSGVGVGSGSGKATGTVAVAGIDVTSDELKDYFNNYIRMDDDSFNIELWLGKGKNPMLFLESLSYAKRIHNDVVLPAATYYKQIIYGSPTYPIRLGQIIYGITPAEIVTDELRGSEPSRHRLGQAGNFRLVGVDNDKIIEDIAVGRIRCEYGTIAHTAGVHVSLPFFASNGEIIKGLKLWSDNGVPNFVGYEFN